MNKVLFFLLFTITKSFAQTDTLSIIRSYIIDYEYDKAINILDKISNQKPYDVAILKLMAEANRLKGSTKIAKSLYSKAFLFDSTDASISYNLGNLFENEGNFLEASNWYEKATKNNQHPFYLLKAGKNAISLKKPKVAKNYFEKGYSLNPKLLEYDFCKLLIDEGSYFLADSILNTTLIKDSLNTKLLTLRISSNYRQGCMDETLLDLKCLENMGDTSIFTRRMFGYTYYQLNDWVNALRYFQYLIQQDPDRLENTHYYMAICNKKKNDYDKAIFHYNEAISAGTSDDLGIYYQNLGEIYQLEGNTPKAFHAFTMSNEFVQDGKTLFYLAQYAEINEKNKPKAIELYKTYLTTSDKTFRKSVEERIKYLEQKQK